MHTSGTREANPDRVSAKTLNLVLAAVQAMPATFTAERVMAATNRKSSAVGDALAILRDKGYIVPTVGRRPLVWHKTPNLPPLPGRVIPHTNGHDTEAEDKGLPAARYAALRQWVRNAHRLERLVADAEALGLTDVVALLHAKYPEVTPDVMSDVLVLVDDLGGFDD